jgi:tRNA dimethylallyltransferase
MSQETDSPPLRVICGPTGSGKTQLMLDLAAALGRAARPLVINADSRQLYTGFAVGTAAPTAEEQRRVPHALVGSVSPDVRFTAAHWADAARTVLADAVVDGVTPVVVGGTGFYVRALLTPLFDEPPVDPARRAALRQWMRRRSHEELTRWAVALDPEGTPAGRAQRERAIEMALLTGVPLCEWHRSARATGPARLAVRYLVVDPGGDVLAQRLEQRLHQMLAAGWRDEVAHLAQTVSPDAPAWHACGYLALREAGVGRRTLAEALDAVRIETRQYVKRQRTWYRHQLREGPVTLVDPSHPDALTQAVAWWHATASDSSVHP